jgi:hypothetical protein
MVRLKGEKRSSLVTLCRRALFAAGLVGLWAHWALAIGTSAGTSITTTATVTYTVGSDPTLYTRTASDAFSVLEIIDVVVTWQDGVNVPVGTPHTGAVLTFQVTNTGNGPEQFRLLTTHTLAGDDFDPVVASIWVESNGTQGIQISGATPDTPYVIGSGISFLPDEAATFYLLSDIPDTLSEGQTGFVQLTAEAMTADAAGAPAGTELPNAGVGGSAIVGSTNADGSAQGHYEVSGPAVTLSKSITQINDPYGGNQPYTSAQVTYAILVTVTRAVEELVVADPLPEHLTYVPGSLVLDGTPQTDADDAPVDSSDFDVTDQNTVTVNLGDTVAPATHTITFSATIN